MVLCIFFFFLSSQFKEDSNDIRLKQSIENDLIDNKYGFIRVKDYQEHTGYLINMHSVTIIYFQYLLCNITISLE